jgi:hypothetical protein
MKRSHIFALSTIPSILLFASIGHAAGITATNSGNWSDTNIWDSGTVPGANDVVLIVDGVNVTVETNASAQSISDDTIGSTIGGTVTMAANSTLTIFGNDATRQLTSLDATAVSNTVIYAVNPFFAKQCNYYNLVFVDTNYVNPFPPFGSPWEFFNNFSSPAGPTPMTIAGDMTLMGTVEVQQGSGGSPITIGGNLIIGPGCAWDSSGDILTVAGNAYVYGLLQDLDGARGTNYIGGNLIVAGPSTSVLTWSNSVSSKGVYTNGWYVSDVITWGIGGNLTNNGSIFGAGYGSISFEGTGVITGTNSLTIPTITVDGTYTIGTTITLTTNTPTLHGTLVFDLANPKQIILPAYVGTALYYDGMLNVINSGAPPVTGASYQFFNSPGGYGGSFFSTSFPSLPSGLSWVDNTLSTGSIDVIGTIVGSPILTLSKSGGLLTLSWDSTTFPGYSVQAQTNKGGIGTNWSATGSGTVSPFTIGMNPTNPPVFFRLSNP